jgi:starch-binding outer membrane protein, SusD/RagB family
MKKKFTYVFIVVIMAIASCTKEWLDLSPRNSYTAQNFPTNEDQLEQAVVGIYAKARGLLGGVYWHFGEFMSDNTSFIFNVNDRGGVAFEQLDEFTALADNGSFATLWADSYNGIARANLVIQNIGKVEFANPDRRASLEAEARFWRAWHYFNLVRLYGDVPIIEVIVTTLEEAFQFVNRRPVAEVYERMILPDIAFAVENSKPKAGVAAGRAAKGAALMLQAKVFLTLQNLPQAKNSLQLLLKEGYVLNANFKDNFDPAKKNSAESILEIQTDLSIGQSISFMGQWAPFGTGTAIWGGGTNTRSGTNQPTRDLINAFESGDKRLPVTIASVNTQTLPATSALRVQYPNQSVAYCNKFNYWDAVALGTNIGWPIYRYADALLMLAEVLNREGFPNTDAFAYLNQVRSRAGLPNKTQGNINPQLAINNQQAFALAVEKERQVELAFENHRWFDLLRTGRAVEVMLAHGQREKALKTTVASGAFLNIRTLLAIPQLQVITYGYEQNDVWK